MWHAADPDGLVVHAVVDGRERLETALACVDGDLANPASWLRASRPTRTPKRTIHDGPSARSTVDLTLSHPVAGRRPTEALTAVPRGQADSRSRNRFAA